MEHLYIRGHPPWYARGTPVVKLRDGPHIKIRGKPLFTSNEAPKPRGKPPDKIGLWVQKFTLFFNRQNGLYNQWYGLLRRREKSLAFSVQFVISKEVRLRDL